MSGWERTIWSRGGHPTGADQITAALTFAFWDWTSYRSAQRRLRFWNRFGRALDEWSKVANVGLGELKNFTQADFEREYIQHSANQDVRSS